MILISHRGNINGKNESHENEPTYIDSALSNGYDVEIDVWYNNDKLYLGHDVPEHQVNLKWLEDRGSKLWIHCKNIESVEFFNKCKYNFNFFWHQNDTVTLTSKKHIWVYPGKQPIKNSISVLPELHNDNISQCSGICSDFIQNYK